MLCQCVIKEPHKLTLGLVPTYTRIKTVRNIRKYSSGIWENPDGRIDCLRGKDVSWISLRESSSARKVADT